ncbi:unnamed protein product [Paramecium pentaurelia]|uniref:Uncharacterized protein n=1 Tax=Paramecium pentaurelia TaxID=43138 RepID=A0A8S1TVE0_9CILI|nr:unnamed protein product [Paramecium pentaurelia]
MYFNKLNNIETNEPSIRKVYQTSIQDCCLQLQQSIDSSYKRIDDLLDQIIYDTEQQLNQRFQSSYDFQHNISLPCFSTQVIHNQQFGHQLSDQVTSLIKMSMNHHLKKQQECLNQEMQKQIQQLQSEKQQPILQPSLELILNPINYQLLHENSIKVIDKCRAIAINQDCSMVIVGCGKVIKLFEFKQEVLKQTQVLNEHQNNVFALNFMKNSKEFISGSYDSQIIIWSMDEKNQWVCKQKLNDHNGWILCLILNNNEDIIISGGQDKTIKFWIKQNQWLCLQTITDHTSHVFGLSLNKQQNKVISCGCDDQILIIEQSQQDFKWIVVQKIKVQKYGCRICFINDNVFIFQPYSGQQLHVYELNTINKQYSKIKDIDVKSGADYWFFPIQYIKSKCLIVNKNGNYVNLIRKISNGEFRIEQQIEFGHLDLFGCMSDDGQYLITWDQGSKEIQIRKYNQI